MDSWALTQVTTNNWGIEYITPKISNTGEGIKDKTNPKTKSAGTSVLQSTAMNIEIVVPS